MQMDEWQARFLSLTRALWRWWSSELIGLAPVAWREHLARLRGRLLLAVDESGGAFLAYEAGRRRDVLGRLDLAAADAAQARGLLLGARQRIRPFPSRLVISLPRSYALQPVVTLPLAAERNLDQVIGFEFGRLVPFKRDEVWLSYHVLSRNKSAHNLQLELTVVRRADLGQVLAQAERLGLSVSGIEVAARQAGAPAIALSLDGYDRPARYLRERLLVGGLAGSCAALAVAAVLIPLLRAEAQERVLAARLAEVRHNAMESLDLRKEITAEVRDQNFLFARKQRFPTVTELLAAVTRLTPDDTWLTELQVSGSEIHLIGATSSATTLLGLIDRSPDFRHAAFGSSITRDSRLDRERFDIAAQIAPRGGPQ